MREAREVRGEHGWWEFIRHSKSPELPVVLLEDIGALLGLVLALGGVGLSIATGDVRYDGFGSVAIGMLLGAIACVMAFEMKSLLLDARVTRVIHMRTQHLGPDELLVAAKLESTDGLTVAELAVVIDEVEERLRERVPIARVVYIEPDVHRPGPPA